MEHHRFGGPPWRRGQGFGGFGAPFGPPFGPGGRGRMRRGDIRAVLLAVLADGPGHGYELITRLEARSGGRWRPSPGSVYPTLQLLEEGGLVSSQMVEGKKVYALTEAGRSEVDRRAEEGFDPWSDIGTSSDGDLRGALAQLGAAVWQIGQMGDPELAGQAAAALTDTRRKLYELLARA